MVMSDVLERAREEHAAVYIIASRLKPEDRVVADVEMVRLSSSPERTLDLTVTEVEDGVGPEYADGSVDVWATDGDGQQWRVRSVQPTELDDEMDHHGTANLYRGGEWVQNIGVVRGLTPGDGDE